MLCFKKGMGVWSAQYWLNSSNSRSGAGCLGAGGLLCLQVQMIELRGREGELLGSVGPANHNLEILMHSLSANLS